MWLELVVSEIPGLAERLVVERSQSGGRHVLYRCVTPIPGNHKLAQRTIEVDSSDAVEISGKRYVPRQIADRFEITCTLIETRGEGGLFLCDPTPEYQIEQGSLSLLPILTEAERCVLIEAACALNEAMPVVTSNPSNMLGERRELNNCPDSFPTISKISGVPRMSLMRFSRGESNLRLDMADKLADYFGLQLTKRRKG